MPSNPGTNSGTNSGTKAEAKSSAAEFIATLFNARTSAHILHLRTRSYAQHVALDSFYNEIVSLADSLAENLQGKYGLLDIPDLPNVTPSTPASFLTSLSSYIDANRSLVGSFSDVQNEIDGIVSLISTTYYKVKFLS